MFRLHHHTENYGEEAGKSEFGLSKTFLIDRFAVFADGSYRLDNENRSTASGGGGVRMLYEGWLSGGAERILGANFWYDYEDLERGYEQFGIGLESLGDRWDFRINVNVPVGRREFTGDKISLGLDAAQLAAAQPAYSAIQYRESTMTALNAEVARRLGQRNLWGFLGFYYLDGGGKQVCGGQGGFRGYLASDVAAIVTVSTDPVFNTTVAFGITWFVDLAAQGRAMMAPASLHERLREPVQRNDYVAVWKRTEFTVEP